MTQCSFSPGEVGRRRVERSPGKPHLSRMVTAENSAGSVAGWTLVGHLQQKHALIVSQENQTLVSPRFPGKEQMLGPWEEERGTGRWAQPEDQALTSHSSPRFPATVHATHTQYAHSQNRGHVRGEMLTTAPNPHPETILANIR